MSNNINHGPLAWFYAIIISVLYSDNSRNLILSRNPDIDFERDFNLTKYFKPNEIIPTRVNNNQFKIGVLKKGFLTQLYLKPFFKLLKIKPIMLTRFSNELLAYNMKNHVKQIDFDDEYTNFQSRIICEKYKQEKLARKSDVFIIETVEENDLENVKKCYNEFSYHYITNEDIAKLSETFIYNDIEYVLDSIIVTNYNNTNMSHSIIGFIMDGEYYVHNCISKYPSKFNWLSNKNNEYYLDIASEKLKQINKHIPNTYLKFSFNKGKRLFVYVRK